MLSRHPDLVAHRPRLLAYHHYGLYGPAVSTLLDRLTHLPADVRMPVWRSGAARQPRGCAHVL